jgi:hypothetical protein
MYLRNDDVDAIVSALDQLVTRATNLQRAVRGLRAELVNREARKVSTGITVGGPGVVLRAIEGGNGKGKNE